MMNSVQKISAREAHDMMKAGQAIFLDVRTPEEFTKAHIPGARLVPSDTLDATTVAAAVPDKGIPVLVYCHSGVRSAVAARTLARLGYTSVYDLGGITTWPYETIGGI